MAQWPRPLAVKITKDNAFGTALSPSQYARHNLGLELYDWQTEAVEAVGARIPTSIAAANETGKTTFVIVALILWFLDRYKFGRVVLTSGSWLQVRTQLAPALNRHSYRFPELEFQAEQVKRRGNLDPAVVMFSTDQPGRAEGHHAIDPEFAPLFYVVDEGKSVPDGIYSAVDRCGPQYTLITSSPGASSGAFYRSHHEEREFWHTIRVRSDECPHISPDKIARDLRKYGADDPVFRSMHLAEFYDEGGSLVIQPEEVTRCLESPPEWHAGERVFFLDFAAGGDENVIGCRDGNKVWIAAAWRELDTIQSARTFVEHLHRLGASPTQVFADNGGLGVMMIDALEDVGFRGINRVNFGAPPYVADPDNEDEKRAAATYANRIAQIWFEGTREIKQRRVVIPEDARMIRQMTSRRTKISASQKLGLEPKDELKERGLDSPDRAEVVLGAIVCGSRMTNVLDGRKVRGIRLAPVRLRTSGRARI